MPHPSLRLATRTLHLALISKPQGRASECSSFEVCVWVLSRIFTKFLTLGTKIGSENYIAENQDFRIVLLACSIKRHCRCLWKIVKVEGKL